MMYNLYTASTTSVVKGAGSSLTEAYYPLWIYSNGTASNATTTIEYLQKGTTSLSASIGTTSKLLPNLNSNWSSSQKFAFECSIYSNTANNAYAVLYDATTGTSVSGATLSTASNTATLLRSGQFTLTPGHSYAVALYAGAGSSTAYLTKAHLIAFLS